MTAAYYYVSWQLYMIGSVKYMKNVALKYSFSACFLSLIEKISPNSLLATTLFFLLMFILIKKKALKLSIVPHITICWMSQSSQTRVFQIAFWWKIKMLNPTVIPSWYISIPQQRPSSGSCCTSANLVTIIHNRPLGLD